MKKISRIVLLVCLLITITGAVYGITIVVRKFAYNNVTINPTYKSTLSEHTINNLWVGTLDLAWKELEERIGVSTIQIEGNDIPQIVADLNASTFSKTMLNQNDYEIKIEEVLNGQRINVNLDKNLTFFETFDNFNDLYRDKTFGDGEKHIKYFGINSATTEIVSKNVEVLFYDSEKSKESFAVKLNTQEGDEIILYRTNDKKSFEEYYEDLQEKAERYEGARKFIEDDKLLIPYIKVNGIISYDELLGKVIKDTGGKYFSEITQTIKFCLNEKGCNLNSIATIAGTTMGISGSREFYFTDPFVIFMKEKNENQPYFVLKVDNDDILESIEEEYKGPIILDYSESELNPENLGLDTSTIEPKEYKFYEDEIYEYYYPSTKTNFVFVSLYPYGMLDMTAEEALKEGVVTIDTFDRCGIDYIKKEK